MRYIFAAMALLAASISTHAEDGLELKELRALYGEWKLVGTEVGGKKTKDDGKRIFKIEGTRMIGAKADGTSQKSFFTINPKENPKEIDVYPNADKNQWEAALGIYEIADGRLMFCVLADENSTKRPKSFDTTEQPRAMVYLYERVSKPKAQQ